MKNRSLSGFAGHGNLTFEIFHNCCYLTVIFRLNGIEWDIRGYNGIKTAGNLNFSGSGDAVFNFFCAQDSFNFFEAERKLPFRRLIYCVIRRSILLRCSRASVY